MTLSLGAIVDALGGELHGDRTQPIRALSTLALAGPDALAFVANVRYRSQLAACRAACVIVGPELLSVLDAFEGVSAGEIEGSEYRRVETTVMKQDSQTLSAWVWEWRGPVDDSQRVSGGDWLKEE